MPFRPMTEKEIQENNKLIAKIQKEIDRLENDKAFFEKRKVEGVWFSDINWQDERVGE